MYRDKSGSYTLEVVSTRKLFGSTLESFDERAMLSVKKTIVWKVTIIKAN